MQTPTTTETLAPGDLAGVGWYRTVSATGIATEHELWVNESGTKAVYVHAPASGPVASISQWARTERELPAWAFDLRAGAEQIELQFEAEDYVIEQARAEVRAELSS